MVLLLVPPFCLGSHDSAVARGVIETVRGEQKLVSSEELAPVVRRAVANDNLGGVFVRHNDSGLRQTRAVAQRVVGRQGLLGHASVLVTVGGEDASAAAVRAVGRSYLECEADSVERFVLT